MPLSDLGRSPPPFRRFLPRALAAFLLVVAMDRQGAGPVFAADPAATPRKPNIVIILADDKYGWHPVQRVVSLESRLFS
jgi:hypothetical protein